MHLYLARSLRSTWNASQVSNDPFIFNEWMAESRRKESLPNLPSSARNRVRRFKFIINTPCIVPALVFLQNLPNPSAPLRTRFARPEERFGVAQGKGRAGIFRPLYGVPHLTTPVMHTYHTSRESPAGLAPLC